VTVGTISTIADDLPGGTVDLVTRTGNIGTIESGTVTVTNPAGTQHAEDDAHSTGDGGNLIFGVRDDAGTSIFTDGTGDYSPISLTDKGEVRVSGASAGTVVEIEQGTISVLPDPVGSVTMTVGTVTVLPDLPGGTVDLVTTVSNLTNGSVRMTVGTVTVLPDLPGGTVDLVTTVSNLTNGSVRMTVGTLTQGSLTNVGEIHTAGTLSALPDLPGGTIDSITNIVAGTITRIEGGTIDTSSVTSPQYNYQTSAALAAGGTVALVFGDITDATTGQLQKMVLSSSVPIRAAVQTYDGTTTTTTGVMFTSASNPNAIYEAPSKETVTLAGSGTASKFQAHITNMDNALAADVYGVAFWDEV
jgi:hypothetical protein